MSYQDMFEQAEKAKTGRALSAAYVEFKKAGTQIVGKLVSRNPVSSSQGEGSYNQYLFETDKGMVKCALGTATDNEAGSMMGQGGVYSITFKGKEDIGRGRKINKFDIFEIQAPVEGVVGGSSDVPF